MNGHIRDRDVSLYQFGGQGSKDSQKSPEVSNKDLERKIFEMLALPSTLLTMKKKVNQSGWAKEIM